MLPATAWTEQEILPARYIFIDDAHTFGGTQTALAWTIYTVLRKTDASVLCLCSARTRKAIEEVVGEQAANAGAQNASPRLQFELAPSALPLNLFFFPLRLLPWWRLLRRVRRGGRCTWWLNLADIEFCLAPLLILHLLGENTHSYLHGTARFTFFHKAAGVHRKLLSQIRDAVANRYVFRLHRCLVAPSEASRIEVAERIASRQRPVLGALYYPPIGRAASRLVPPAPPEPPDATLKLWMIGNVVQGHKNNWAALDVLEALHRQGQAAGLTVAGLGPDLARFKRDAEQRGLTNRIVYLGWVNEPCEKAPSSAIVLIPSFHETMNIVAREAMRNGLRLVASPIPVFHEWIPASLLAESFSTTAFVRKILQVQAMDGERLGSEYRLALARFSMERFLETFLDYSRFTNSSS